MSNLDDDEIDKLKLPAAVKLAKQREIDITGLRDLEEIKCQLKKYLLTDRRNRESVNYFLLGLLSLCLSTKKPNYCALFFYSGKYYGGLDIL